MNAPDTIREIAAECAAEHLSDIDAAVTCWRARIEAIAGYTEWVQTLVEQAGRELIHDARHAANVARKRQAREYGGGPRTQPGQDVVDIVRQSYLDYCIDGRRLGDLHFSELDSVAAAQEAVSRGALFNARLCRALANFRPRRGDPTIQEQVRERDLRTLFRDLQGPEPPDEGGMAMAGH